MDLYEELKARVIEVTHSQFAVPLLDRLFEQPIFQSAHLQLAGCEPSRQAIHALVRTLRDADILKVVREGSGRRGQVLALVALVNLCEAKTVI
jgi:hypothetical protein